MSGCESWTIKKAEHWRADAYKLVLKKSLECPLENKEIKPVNLKGNNTEYSLEGQRLKLPYFGHLMWTADSLEKPLMQERSKSEKKATEDEMVGWYHWFNGHEIGQVPGDNEGQGSLVCCSPWGLKESDTTWLLNNNRKMIKMNKPQLPVGLRVLIKIHKDDLMKQAHSKLNNKLEFMPH